MNNPPPAAAHRLPSAIANAIRDDENAVLVVIPENMPDTTASGIFDALERYYKGVCFHPWNPSDVLLGEIAGQTHQGDSQARLYSLAILAHRSEVPGFLVVSFDTRVTFERHPDRFPTTMVRIRQPLEQQGGKQVRHELHILYSSIPLCYVTPEDDQPAEDRAAKLLHALYASDLREILHSRKPLRGRSPYYTLELHDPDRPVFSADSSQTSQYEDSVRKMNEALLLSSPLPPELVHKVVPLTHQHPVAAPIPTTRRSRNCLNIHLLSPASSEELRHTQAAIEHAVQSFLVEEQALEQEIQRSERAGHDWLFGPSEFNFFDNVSDDEMFDRELWAGSYNAYDDHDDIFQQPTKSRAPNPEGFTTELIPWAHSRIATRRDLASIWSVYHRHTSLSNTINFLHEPIRDGTPIDRAQFISLYETPFGFPLVSVTTLSSMVRELVSPHHAKLRLQELTEPLSNPGLSCPDDMEILIEPDRSIHWSGTGWNHFPSNLRPVTVFYLTNKLSEEERAAIEDRIYASEPEIPDMYDEISAPDYRFTPWGPNEADGGLGEMWYELRMMRATTRYRYSDPPYLFIDLQSLVDGTVTAAAPNLHWGDPDPHQILRGVSDPKLKGMLYCRVPADRVYGLKFDYSSRTVPFRPEMRMEANTFPRPDWPGHGILRTPDDYVPVVHLRC